MVMIRKQEMTPEVRKYHDNHNRHQHQYSSDDTFLRNRKWRHRQLLTQWRHQSRRKSRDWWRHRVSSWRWRHFLFSEECIIMMLMTMVIIMIYYSVCVGDADSMLLLRLKFVARFFSLVTSAIDFTETLTQFAQWSQFAFPHFSSAEWANGTVDQKLQGVSLCKPCWHIHIGHGRRSRGTWGTSPLQNLEWGNANANCPPQIFVT